MLVIIFWKNQIPIRSDYFLIYVNLLRTPDFGVVIDWSMCGNTAVKFPFRSIPSEVLKLQAKLYMFPVKLTVKDPDEISFNVELAALNS